MTLTYSLAEAAERIPCSQQWLARGLRSGRFAARKIAGRWRFTDTDLEAIIMNCRVKAQSPTPAFEFVTRGSRANANAPP
jgi:hypothetical protein